MATDQESLDPNFKALFESLNSARVRYLVLGGYAVNYYGYHRATDDLDIWISVDAENARRVSQALKSFGGFTASKVAASRFLKKGFVFVFGREPLRVDILTGASGVDFEACYARRRHTIWGGVRVPLISLGDLLVNKKASARNKDMADIDRLPKKSPSSRRKSISKNRRKPKS